jgi:hypothetical protein
MDGDAGAKAAGFADVQAWRAAVTEPLPWWSCIAPGQVTTSTSFTESASGLPVRWLVQGWEQDGRVRTTSGRWSMSVEEGMVPDVGHRLTHYEAKTVVLLVPLAVNIVAWSLLVFGLLQTRRVYGVTVTHMRRKAGLCPMCGHVPMRDGSRAWCTECGWGKSGTAETSGVPSSKP